VLLSPSSITWYRPSGGDALRLERYPWAWRKVMAVIAGWMTYILRTDGLYTGISSGPNARYRVLEAFTFTFFVSTIPDNRKEYAKHRPTMG